MTVPATRQRLDRLLASHGLICRGVVPLEQNAEASRQAGFAVRSVALIGHVGGQFWSGFEAWWQRHPEASEPLDSWSVEIITSVAPQIGGFAVFPSDGPPYWPFQTWARQAEPLTVSPLKLLIHSDYGVWHAYRGAVLLPDTAADAVSEATSPCLTCIDQPCLNTCPVAAVSQDDFAALACAAHLQTEPEASCAVGGCIARRACPVGPGFQYSAAQMVFHQSAFVAVRGPD
ncbi:MAG: ferredoxin [Pseudomonadota bacterium]